MPTPVLMPALSPTMEDGTLAAWHVKEGDIVSSGDIIAEIETDKATMEVEAVDEGVVGKLLLPAGSEGVLVNTPIAMLLAEGETEADIGTGRATNPPEAGRTAVTGAKSDQMPVAGDAASSPPVPAPHPDGPPVKETKMTGEALTEGGMAEGGMAEGGMAGTTPSPPATGARQDRLKASPLARRMASQNGLDLGALSGTGPHGRIIKRDIEAALAQGGTAGMAVHNTASTARAGEEGGLDPHLYPQDSYEIIKNDGMRKVIAARLSQSFNNDVPHFPLVIDCEIDTLLAARARMNAISPKDGDGAYKLSVNDFILKASAMALIKVPAANASYTHEAIIRHRHADIGVAVAIDGGLITPIIRKAETKGLVEISQSIKEMAARARQRRLKPEEYQGGTFSVSNLGMFGIKSFASIINQPQGCIMSVGTGEQRPVVREGALGVATVMTITLTCDHRVVDGAVGAAFLGAFRQFIEEPASMLL